MASENQVVTLFSAETTNTTGTAQKITPRRNKQPREYNIFLRGDLGSGTFKLEVSFDGTNYSNWLLTDSTEYAQTVLGYSYKIESNLPMHVRGVLSGSSGASLTAELFYRFEE